MGLTAAGMMLFSMANNFKAEAASVVQAGELIQPGAIPSGCVFFLSPVTTLRIGKTWLTCRGKIDADHFPIDVTISELDPQTYYPHKLNIADARKGFSIVGQVYRQVGMHATGIRLKNG